MSRFITHIRDADFEATVRNANQPVLVDFWADWCGPCHAIAPVLEELAEEFEGQLQVVKINVDENPDTAQALGIRSIPSLYLFKDGQAVANRSGAVGLSQLRNFVEAAL